MNGLLKCFPVIFAGIFFASCSPVYYAPNAQNIPVFKKRGEFRLSGVADGDQFNMQTAYSFSDHFGFMLNSAFMGRDEGANGGSGTLWEGGIGYYHPLSKHFVVECYGLLAGGKLENHFYSHEEYYDKYHGHLEARLNRIGIQPSFTYTTRYFEASVSTRISRLHYSHIEGNLKDDQYSEVAYLQANNTSVLFEPAITLRAGFEHVKVQLQVVGSMNQTNPEFKQINNVSTLGLILQF